MGIGAQRSGTGWISRLLVQHPSLGFGTNGVKEQSYLHRIPDGKGSEREYMDFFPDDGVLRGDWSPRYLPLMIVPHIAKRVMRAGAPIFVLLRDPVERFVSGMRYAKNRGIKSDFHDPVLARAHQFGQYASALEGWATLFPKEQFVVVTYEEAREDVDAACKRFWDALGVGPHPLEDPYGRVKPATGDVEWDLPEGTRECLVGHYLPQVLWLRDHWGVDVKRWRNFEGLV